VPAEPPAALPIDSSLFFKLVRLVNLTARPFVETLSRAHNLSLNEWRTLLVLASHPGVAAHEVVDFTGLDKMSVSRALAALERSGRLLKRPDPADGRRALLELTPAGRALFEVIGRPAAERERQLFSGLRGDDAKRLAAIIDRLTDAIQDPGLPP
jgi:DNA-binding MarR family transcriptional regulator